MAEMNLAGSEAVDAAALDSLRRHKGSRAEPYLVAAIFRDTKFRTAIVNAIEPAWRPVAVRTVFAHLTPKVTFSCPNGPCEMGDALVVYRERLRAGQRRRQAILFQAKVWHGNGRGWVNTDPDQHALYRHWPPFKVAGGPMQEIALGDESRRTMLEILRTHPATAGELAEALPIARPGVSRHLRVLREAGLVEVEQQAQWRIYRLRPEPLVELDSWLGRYRVLWERRLDALHTEIARGKREKRMTT